MASDRKQPLVSLGPFLGLVTTAVGPTVPPGHAAAASNANPNRYTGALTCENGRLQVANLNIAGTGSQLVALAPYTATGADQQIIVLAVKSGTYSWFVYDLQYNTQAFATYGSTTNNQVFDQSLQYGLVLYLNSGQQYSVQNPGVVYQWHYPAPNPYAQGYGVSASTAGGLAAGYYYYAFTQVVQIPNYTYTQETSEYGADVIANAAPPTNYPYYANIPATGSVNITGTFAGTNPDGSTYTTNVYRQSTNQAGWFLLTNLTTNGTYNDTTSDATISANAQLTFHRDPPPGVGTNSGLPAICIHKERTWAFTIVNDASTGFVPQSQLLYSNLGRPWEFDYLNNAILLGNSATTTSLGGNAFQALYGDYPIAIVSLSSILVCFRTRSIWQVTGNDQTSFVATQVTSTPGCRARQSIAVGPIGQTIGVFWLSDQGVFVFDGSTPMRIDENVRATIRALSIADRTNAVGWYSRLTYYLSFPGANFTLGYFTPTGEWFQLPYSTPYAYSISANPRYYGANSEVNEVTAVRNGTTYIDSWFAGGDADLGAPQTVTWTSPLTDCGSPAVSKIVSHLVVLAPPQSAGATCTVTLTLDSRSWTSPVFTLGSTTRNICEVPTYSQGSTFDNRGFLVGISVTMTTVPGVSTQIYAVAAYGETDRMLSLPQ